MDKEGLRELILKETDEEKRKCFWELYDRLTMENNIFKDVITIKPYTAPSDLPTVPYPTYPQVWYSTNSVVKVGD